MLWHTDKTSLQKIIPGMTPRRNMKHKNMFKSSNLLDCDVENIVGIIWSTKACLDTRTQLARWDTSTCSHLLLLLGPVFFFFWLSTRLRRNRFFFHLSLKSNPWTDDGEIEILWLTKMKVTISWLIIHCQKQALPTTNFQYMVQQVPQIYFTCSWLPNGKSRIGSWTTSEFPCLLSRWSPNKVSIWITTHRPDADPECDS